MGYYISSIKHLGVYFIKWCLLQTAFIYHSIKSRWLLQSINIHPSPLGKAVLEHHVPKFIWVPEIGKKSLVKGTQ